MSAKYSPSGIPEHYYYGCWDSNHFRDVEMRLPSPLRTIENCLRLCASIDATFAGM